MKKTVLGLLLYLNLFAGVGVGDSAVSFELPNLYKPTQILNEHSLRGKVVLLNVWASWCSGCQEEMPLFVKLQKEYNKNDFMILTSNIDNEVSSAKKFLKGVDKAALLEALYDANKVLPKAYHCPGMPSSFLITKEGKIAKVYIGSLDKNDIKALKKSINTLLEQ